MHVEVVPCIKNWVRKE